MHNPKQHHLLSSNPSSTTHASSIKSRFTRGFVRALIKLRKRNYNQPTCSSSCSRREILGRYRRVKIAADKSMAVAVGSRRAWSRAMLWRIHHHQTWRYRSFLNKRNHFTSNYNQPMKIKRLVIEKKQKKTKKKKKDDDEEKRGYGEAGELRKLVPGGEAMDLCSLLDETAHYIKCLVTQVQVMRTIDQLYSI